MTRWTRRDDRALREQAATEDTIRQAHEILRILGVDPDTATIEVTRLHVCGWRCSLRTWWDMWGPATAWIGAATAWSITIIVAVTR